MRAYMSEGSRFDAVERAQSTFEQTAEREARAILADTEAYTLPGDNLALRPEYERQAQNALIEALAAFVEQVGG